MSWLRVRFKTKADDPRPIEFPPPGPYWISGYTGEDAEAAILIAYLQKESDLEDFWPEAFEPEFTECAEITFTDRFPKPDWWT